DASLDAADERRDRVGPPGELADTRDELVHLGDTTRVDDVDGNTEPPQLQERLFAIALVGAHDEVGLERDDGLETRIDHATHARLGARGGRPVAEVAHPDEARLAAERE